MSVESEVAREERIERLIREIGQEIEAAQPARREELRQMAFDLLGQETQPSLTTERLNAGVQPASRSFSLLTFGISLLVLAGVLFLLIPFVAAVFAVVGAISIVFSLIYRFVGDSSLKFRHGSKFRHWSSSRHPT